jgi:integrase
LIEPEGDWEIKNKESRKVAICPELERILRNAPRRSIYVLSKMDGGTWHANNGAGLLRWMKRFYRRAGIAAWQEICVHTLRHTYTSQLSKQNVSREKRAKLVGHRCLSMQDRYTHTEEADALEAGRKLSYA